jgi:hypothetical protein
VFQNKKIMCGGIFINLNGILLHLKKKVKLFSLEYHVDPRGLIPKWIVRTFQKNWPHTTLKDLDRYLQNEAIAINPILYDIAPDLMDKNE